MDLFAKKGAHVLVDGQFGSTGKGLMASYLAEKALETNTEFYGVVSNAGPNSGHTFYIGGIKHVLKQLPSFAVATSLMGGDVPVFLSAGAVIDRDVLLTEANKYPKVNIYVHENAAVLTDADKRAETSGSIAAVAGTRSGTGSALARKVSRDPEAIWGSRGARGMPHNISTYCGPLDYDIGRWFVEVSQGFSLGINSQFYPKVTSRECTVMQGISDARIAAQLVSKVYMVIRTFPIRVGNVDGFSSGHHYSDQHEIAWEDIGVEPELTTVTQRQRRIFSFSVDQVTEAVQANRPDIVLVNFMNYLDDIGRLNIIRSMEEVQRRSGVRFDYFTGYGPNNNDIVPF